MLSTNGDTFLGGEDFDLRVINFLGEEFLKESGVDVRRDPLAMQRLKEAAEKAKIELSSTQANRCEPAVHHGGCLGSQAPEHQAHARETGVTGGGSGQKTMDPCRVALKDAGLAASDVAEVILVGGQTRSRWFRSM